MVEVESEHVTEVFTGFGEKRVRAEAVADRGRRRGARLPGRPTLRSGPHLADQLILPLALAGGGRFRTTAPTAHTRTQLAVVQRFLDVKVALTEGADGTWTFACQR